MRGVNTLLFKKVVETECRSSVAYFAFLSETCGFLSTLEMLRISNARPGLEKALIVATPADYFLRS